MSYVVQFVGLAFFNWQADGNMRVLLPDGRAVPNVQPHKFSISIAPGAYAVDPATTGWTAGKNMGQFDEDKFQTQFWFPPSIIELPGTELAGPHPTLDAQGQIPRLPSLRATDPQTKIDPDNPQTRKIADLTMAQGTFEAFKIPGGNPNSCAIISQLTVDHNDVDNIILTLTEIADLDPNNAATSNPGTVRRIVLKPKTEIAIVNTSRGAGKAAAEKSHYSIYEQLTYAPCVLVAPQIQPMNVPPSTSQHPFFSAPDAAVTGPGCSNATI